MSRSSACSAPDHRLDEVYDLGVRQMELVNKFDNALSGVAGDGGSTGAVATPTPDKKGKGNGKGSKPR